MPGSTLANRYELDRKPVEQPTVLIITDEAEFARSITCRWQSERSLPAFVLMSSNVRLGFDPETFDLAIVGSIPPAALSVVLEALDAAGKRVLFVSPELAVLEKIRDRWPAMLALRRQENWLDTLILVGAEALHRVRAEASAMGAEKTSALLEQQATLGRYMLEMRHTLNNTLTAMLGNSELLLLEPGLLSAEARSQIETIRHMALRIHEVLRRFSSLEKELMVLDREAGRKPGTRPERMAAAF
jgi:signal transduction histidine kinase